MRIRLLIAGIGLAWACASTPVAAAEPSDQGGQETPAADTDADPWPSWLETGGDLRLRVKRELARRLDKDEANQDRLWQRYRARLWAKVAPHEDLEFNVRVLTEPRYYCRRDDLEHPLIREEGLFDQAYVKWKDAFGLPLTLTIGRQDLGLGSTWLIREGTPMDGSRTSFFDAIRLTCEIESIDTTADLVWIDNHANSSEWVRPFNDRDVDLIEQDEQGVILYLSNRSIKDTRIDGYFIYKRAHNPASPLRGRTGDVYTFGLFIEGKIDSHWDYRTEFAPQFARRNGKDVFAFGTDSTVTYHFRDPMRNRIGFGYEYLSGDDDPDRYFDRVWGREGQWSDLYEGAIDGLDGREFDAANLHRPKVHWQFNPVESVTVSAEYALVFAEENTQAAGTRGLSRSGLFRGQHFKTNVAHRISKHVSHRFTGQAFFPGDFYTDQRNDVAVFLRYEIVFTW